MINMCNIANPPIGIHKIQSMFKQIDCLVGQLLDKVSDILMTNGIRYFIKPSRQSLMRMLTPYQLKVYVDFTDVCCLFDNRSEIIRDTLQRENSNQRYFKEHKSTEQSIQVKDKIRNKRDEQEKSNDLNGKNNYKFQNILFKNLNQFPQKISPDFDNMFGQFRSLNPHNKYYIQKHLKQKICEWAKYQTSKGKSVTRFDVKNKAVQIGSKYKIKFGARWLNKFISHDNDIRQLLTHGNSNQLKKTKINNSYVVLKTGAPNQNIKQQADPVSIQQQYENSSNYDMYEQQEKQEGSPYISESDMQINNKQKVSEDPYKFENNYNYYKRDENIPHEYQQQNAKK